ncbi:uncharacterized protein MYCGRDRAFT_103130, partial [Zymoseptoria tritici IPO323]
MFAVPVDRAQRHHGRPERLEALSARLRRGLLLRARTRMSQTRVEMKTSSKRPPATPMERPRRMTTKVSAGLLLHRQHHSPPLVPCAVRQRRKRLKRRVVMPWRSMMKLTYPHDENYRLVDERPRGRNLRLRRRRATPRQKMEVMMKRQTMNYDHDVLAWMLDRIMVLMCSAMK